MKITLHNESIDIEVGQKVVFYTYKINDNNELEVETDETFVDSIGELTNRVTFENGKHASALSYYQNKNRFGKRFYLSDTKENRLDYLKFKVESYKLEQHIYENSIEETCDLLSRYISRRKEVSNSLESVNKLIEQLGKDKDE